MSLITQKINSVLASALPCAIDSAGGVFAEPCWILVQWRSDLQDMFFQVYINGRFAGETTEPSQRELLVPYQFSHDLPMKIEVLAVEQSCSTRDNNVLLDSQCYSGRVRLVILRSQNLPLGTTAEIFYDNGGGQIDYSRAISEEPILIWPRWQEKAGFGFSRFGWGDFGYDSSPAVGFGAGRFGFGQFGLDADAIIWQSHPLKTGVYKFAVVLTDSRGIKSPPSEADPVIVISPAKPPAGLEVHSYDSDTKHLVLKVL